MFEKKKFSKVCFKSWEFVDKHFELNILTMLFCLLPQRLPKVVLPLLLLLEAEEEEAEEASWWAWPWAWPPSSTVWKRRRRWRRSGLDKKGGREKD